MMIFTKLKMRLGKILRRIAKKGIKRETKILLFSVIAALVTGSILGGCIGRASERRKAERTLQREVDKVTQELVQENQEKDGEIDELQGQLEEATNPEVTQIPWYLTLVNRDHPMDYDYDLDLVELKPGYEVDARIAESAKKMLADAKAAGLNVVICSAYRSVVRQEQVFNESVKERLSRGLNYWDAFEDTRLSVAEPGTSEHAMGLALDLVSSQYTELDERQETTKEAKWLAENCHKYGFILRYPPSKTQITGIIYEPWHYRYVGVEDATKIMELGITLEEYLEEYYGK